MLISIKNIARQNRIRLPDLLTRPVGRAMYASAKKKIEQAGPDETVVCDFDEVQVIDPSFVDEFVIMMLKDSVNGPGSYHMRIRNISKSAEQNIRSVMESYYEYTNQRFAIITEDLTSENTYVIGTLTEPELEVIELIRVNRSVTEKSLADSLDITMETGHNILEELVHLRLIKSNENVYSLV
ncbi:MAG: hypothetical protein ACOC2H_08505 [Spirochaetota bacterium]